MDGCREDGRQPEGWWQASDGRWYPPSLARHPAARHEPGAASGPEPESESAPRSGQGQGQGSEPEPATERGAKRRVWLVWAALLVPLAGVVGLVLVMIGLATGSRLGRTELAHEDAARRPAATSSTVATPGTAAPAASGSAPALPGPPDVTAPALPHDGGPTGRVTPPSGDTPSVGSATPPGMPSGSDGTADPGPAPAPPQGSGRPPAATPQAPVDPPPVPPGDPPGGQVPTHSVHCQNGGWASLVDDTGQPFDDVAECLDFVEDALDRTPRVEPPTP